MEVALVRPLEVAESVLPAPAVPEKVTALKVATPAEAFTDVVPLTVTPVPPSVIEADDPVTVFALASTTRTDTGVPKLLPASTEAAGCCTKARAAAGPTFRVKEFDVAEVRPLDVAESVLPAPAVPAMVTELNVATPEVAFTVAVPLTVTPVPPSVIEAVEPVTVLEAASTTRTDTAGEKLLPTATLADGCWENSNAVAVPALRVNEFEVAAVSPVEVALRVFPAPAVPLKVTELKVATPDEALTVAVPLTVTPVPPSVMAAVEPVTVLELASITRTATAVAKLLPTATLAAGCCEKASAAAVPGSRVNALEVAPVSPVDVAAIVLPAPAVPLTVRALNVATPETALTVEVPPRVTPVPASAIEAVEPVTVLPAESCTVTCTCGEKLLPTVTVEGCTEKASLLAAPAVSANAVEVADVSPVAAAVRVLPELTSPLTVIPVKVAIPAVAVAVSFVRVRPVPLSVMESVAVVTRLPPASMTSTVTAGVTAAPLTTEAGMLVTKRSAAAGPAFTVKLPTVKVAGLVLVAPLTPEKLIDLVPVLEAPAKGRIAMPEIT